MKKPVAMTLKLAELKTNLYVRQTLNHDRVEMFVGLIQAGVELPPLAVNTEGEIIDGRHRKEAYEICGIQDVKVEVYDITEQAELIAAAYKANDGGSLPPSSADTEHTIMLLLKNNITKKRIGEMLGLPPAIARTYVNSVQSKLNRLAVRNAAEAVAEGKMSVPAAAEHFGVEIDTLKDHIKGVKGPRSKKGVQELQVQVTTTHRSLSSKNAALMRSVMAKYQDGDMSRKQVLAIIEHIENLQKKGNRSIADWKARFLALDGEKSEAA